MNGDDNIIFGRWLLSNKEEVWVRKLSRGYTGVCFNYSVYLLHLKYFLIV